MSLLTLISRYTPPSSAPVISSFNSDGTLYHGQSCTISGLQFTGVAGTITLVRGSLSQVQSSGVSWADTSITFTANTSIFPYGPIVLRVTNANGTAEANVTLIPVATKGYVVVDVPWPVDAYSVLQGASPAAVDGDQIEYELLTNNSATVTMFADGTFTISDDTEDHTFHVRAFDESDLTWSAAATITVNYQATVTIVAPVDGDGQVQLGQVGATIIGTNFGATAGTVTIGGVAQTVQTWSATQITIIVNPATPLGTQNITVTTAAPVVSGTVTVSVVSAPGIAPVFLGPTISVANLTQNTAATPLNVSGRFQDPAAQVLTYAAQGTWPAGVIVTAVSGTIQGLPTVAGTYNGLAVRATDPDGNFVDSNTFTITVNAATVVVPPDPVPSDEPVSPGVSSGISDVLIANLALTKLGEARIISFGDDTKAARAITAIYDITRDAELRRRKWRFSLKRASLPALASSPEFGYAYAYQLPADCLSILSVGDIAPGVDLSDYRTGLDMGLYSLEGRQILTDLGAPLNLRYKARITDPAQFDIAFVAALASRLAYELAEDLTQSAAKREQAGTDYKVALREAVAANAIEVAPDVLPDNSWLISRQ